MRGHSLSICIAVAALAVAGTSCGLDPVHDKAISALGPEVEGVEPGPDHRPGQPCLVCHGGDGPAGQHFTVAGTIFRAANENPPVGMPNAHVVLVDSAGYEPPFPIVTSASGNFYITKSDWDPVFPLRVRVDYTAKKSGPYPGISPMTSMIGRDGSCASCHKLTPDPISNNVNGPTQPGFIYIASDKADPGLQ